MKFDISHPTRTRNGFPRRSTPNLATCFVFLFLLSSCTVVSQERGSFPVGDRVQGRLHQEKLVYQDVELSLQAYNTVTVWEYMTFTIIPIYWNTEERRPRTAFHIRVGFLPKEGSFSFEPEEIRLIIDDQAQLRPSKYLFLPHDEKRKPYMRKLTKEGRVACGSWGVDYPFVDVRNTRDTLDDSGLWSCFVLSFDVPPPDPNQRISLQVGGVKKDGQAYSFPSVGFSEKIYKHFDSVP